MKSIFLGQSRPIPARIFLALVVLLLATLSPGHADNTPADELIELQLGDNEFILRKRVREKVGSRLIFFAPHDNESIGVKMAEEVLETSGGKLFELKSRRENGGENRYLDFTFEGCSFRVDPNRIYTELGVSENLKLVKGKPGADVKAVQSRAAAAVRAFGQTLLEKLQIEGGSLLVALHNNWHNTELSWEGYVAKLRAKRDGGRGLYHPVGRRTVDEDDFFLTTSQALHEALGRRGYNSILETPGSAPDDGSLSVYCGNHQPLIPMVNVEAEHEYPGGGERSSRGHAKQQRRMIEAVVVFHENQQRPSDQRKPIPRPVP